MSQKTVTITTAIVYPNGKIHVGWAWECLGADWLARANRLMGRSVFFSTGADEHSINVQKAAEAKGQTPKAYCDDMSAEITRILKQMGMSYDRYIRTSDPDHVKVVQKLVQKAFDQGDIYQGKYEGYYCESCEAYYTEKDLTDKKCPNHPGKEPKWLSEENYFFRLSKYQDALLKHFETHPHFLMPEHRRNEILNFVKAGLKDFSVSRSNFTWGISLPWDPKHVVYVWFDALINYVTAAGFNSDEKAFQERWPAAYHIVGKDIARFHTVYWPAMLMSVGIELPKQVFAHGWLTIKGERMSKSSGIAANPEEVMQWSDPDPFRYYLLAENQFAGDGNYSPDALLLKNNADLSNDLGNLVNRSISMTRKYFPDEKIAPRATMVSEDVRTQFQALKSALETAITAVDPALYVQECMARSRALNLFIDRMKPWALAKDPAQREVLAEVLYTLLEGVRWIATALMPVCPFSTPEFFRQLGIAAPSEQGAFSEWKWGTHGYQPIEPKPIFRRLELPAETT